MTRLTKFFLFAFLCAFTVFFGGSLVRTAIGYNFFIPGTLNLKENLPQEFFATSLSIYSITAFYTTVSYLLALLAALFLLFAYRRRLRQLGWLLMSFVLFFLVSPVQFFQMYYEYEIYQALERNSFAEALQFFLKFFEIGGPATMIATFAYLTIFAFVAWRPLHITAFSHNEN